MTRVAASSLHMYNHMKNENTTSIYAQWLLSVHTAENPIEIVSKYHSTDSLIKTLLEVIHYITNLCGDNDIKEIPFQP